MPFLPTNTELRLAYRAWRRQCAPYLAGALAYTTMLSIAPLLLVVLGIGGVFYQQAALNAEVLTSIDRAVGPAAADLIRQALEAGEHQLDSYLAIVIGTVIALIGAIGIFHQLQQSANIIWNVKSERGFSQKTVLRYAILILLLVLTSALVITSTILSAVFSYYNAEPGSIFAHYSLLIQIIQAFVSFGFLSLLFSLLFKILPETYVHWKHVWFAGIFTALLFNIGKYLMGWYLAVGSVGSVYGAAGSFIALMVWTFYAAQIFLYGMELVKVRQMYKS